MLRLFALLGCAAVFAFSAAFAQDAFAQEEAGPVKFKATPEILSLFDESLQSLSQVEPMPRAGGLFQLLGFAVNFEDRAHAQRIIDALLALAPSIEPEELRTQLYAGVVSAFLDMEKYPQAIAAVNQYAPPADRHEWQLDIAARIIIVYEQENTPQPFGVSELLQQALAGALAAQDVVREGLSRAFLGHELARQGRQAEALAVFAEAMQTAQRINDLEEKSSLVGLILQRQVKHNQIDNAMATLQSLSPDIKLKSAFAFISALILDEKYTEAEALIKTLPSGDMRDDLLGDFVMATITTLTDAQIGELVALVSSGELRERFLQIVTSLLQRNGRSDVAAQVSQRLNDPTVAEMSLFVGKIESLLEAKQFDEAVLFIDEAEENEAIRQHFKRRILMMQYQETRDETVAGKIEATFTSGERIAVAELREEARRAADVSDFTTRIDLLLEIFQEQSRFLDFVGARQTLKLLAEQLDRGTELVPNIQDRLLLARLQVELNDNEGARTNLGKLTQMLSAVTDLQTLRGLVPTLPLMPGMEPTINESAIQNQLFQIYFMTANLLARAEAPTESQAALAKARELAISDSDAAQRAEKLLLLAQFLAEGQLE